MRKNIIGVRLEEEEIQKIRVAAKSVRRTFSEFMAWAALSKSRELSMSRENDLSHESIEKLMQGVIEQQTKKAVAEDGAN